MRKRSVGINVRVSVTEKRKITLMAKRCGLSLSEYLCSMMKIEELRMNY